MRPTIKSIPLTFTIKEKEYLVVKVDTVTNEVILKCDGKYIEMNYYKLVERLTAHKVI